MKSYEEARNALRCIKTTVHAIIIVPVFECVSSLTTLCARMKGGEGSEMKFGVVDRGFLCQDSSES